VIGDPVNEAARLADAAKQIVSRTLASGAALDRADADERSHWDSRDPVLLRGRSEPTRISVPRDHNVVHGTRH
jgi:class 3 adenylate cyclase